MPHPTFRGLDHLAIVVGDTEAALQVWRDRVGLKVLYSELVQNGALRLTHLDLGTPGRGTSPETVAGKQCAGIAPLLFDGG
jgi:catechol 2,3-dioxygenase-like lactoylglutathione lyase family enzyme